MPGYKQGSAGYNTAFTNRPTTTGLWLAGATTPTTPTTPVLVGANGQPLVHTTPTTPTAPTVSGKQAGPQAVTPNTALISKVAPSTTPTAPILIGNKLVAQAPGTYHMALPTGATVNATPNPKVLTQAQYNTANSTANGNQFITVVQLCNYANLLGVSRGYACATARGTTGTLPPLSPQWQVYIGPGGHLVQATCLVALKVAITGK